MHIRPFIHFTIISLLVGFGFVHSSAIQQKEQNPPPQLVLMGLSAHPDDEDGATLAYYAKLKGIKTYSLFLTRGEGGQNEIGSQLYNDLGVIRTKETLEAARILGSEIYFLGFPDFGYSKSDKETYRLWGGKDSVVARLVYFIRALKPDVIISNHDTVTTSPNKQHGHHQASDIAAFDAFEKAADPTYRPDQIRGSITAWQVKKLYSRYYSRDSLQLPPDIVTIDVDQRDQAGTSMEEVFIKALHEHKSQGMSRVSLDSIPQFFRLHYYRSMRENKPYQFDPADLFSGITPSVRQPATIESFQSSPASSLPSKQAKDIHVEFRKESKVAMVATYDGSIQDVMKSFHIPIAFIDSNELSSGTLEQYSSVILDLRAYFFRNDLQRYTKRILEYVRNGGNVVCFYQKPADWNGKKFAPYPMTITSQRVTEEDAKVVILRPDHPIFTTPNLLKPVDWDGWIQERSIYLPSDDTLKTAPLYQRLLAMSDENEAQPPTSLLWTTYGKGTYTYCSLALYRQLRILNEGSLKLFFNMISQPRH